MRRLKSIIILISIMLFSLNSYSQNSSEQGLEFAKKIHNFGKISIASGAQHCTFEFKNKSNKPIVIHNILSSCGCTTPQWPKKPIMPGESGKIDVTYLNDQGPFPFDKSLTVYTSTNSKPIILRITGLAYAKEKSLKEMFPYSIGMLGVKSNKIRGGQINQGQSKSGVFTIANISQKKVSVSFKNISEGLKISVDPQQIPANDIAEISYTIDTKAKTNWGNTIYSANVICNGSQAKEKIEIDCMILDNFDKLSKQEKNTGPMILAENSSYNFGKIAKGKTVEASFSLRNTGHRDLIIYKIETNSNKIKINTPKTVKPGEKFTLIATLDTTDFLGEQVFTITLVTNSPNRPLVNLFVTGTIN